MSHFQKLGRTDIAGYDPDRKLQVLPVGQRTTLYLIAGDGLDVRIDDPSIATVSAGSGDDKGIHKSPDLSAWEKEQTIRKVALAGISTGSTMLRAFNSEGREWAQPITVRVVLDKDFRQVGKTTGESTVDLRNELRTMSLRDAVIRVGEDQMRSAIASRSDGFGAYNIAQNLDWCGAFAYWCWNQATAIRGIPNPFGGNNDVLLSPQKAIHWAMQEGTPGQLLRYEGIDPMVGKGSQSYVAIGAEGGGRYALSRGDIVLVRSGGVGQWKHVCLVDYVEGDSLHSLDGNQGAQNCIKRVVRDMNAKVPGGRAIDYELVFVHVVV